MFPETGKNYKKIEKYAGVQEDPAKVKLQRRIERFPGTGPLSVFTIIKRRGGDVKIKRAVWVVTDIYEEGAAPLLNPRWQSARGQKPYQRTRK